ncbi:hypothetical protein B0H10DRAFT_859564 [Mycena sp. CBHHK59/15]|nr:hypothetical protein B0H10DRAFT_859564 [Mycena sp. CBHHK59/15]
MGMHSKRCAKVPMVIILGRISASLSQYLPIAGSLQEFVGTWGRSTRNYPEKRPGERAQRKNVKKEIQTHLCKFRPVGHNIHGIITTFTPTRDIYHVSARRIHRIPSASVLPPHFQSPIHPSLLFISLHSWVSLIMSNYPSILV